jgi:hypothetical protein
MTDYLLLFSNTSASRHSLPRVPDIVLKGDIPKSSDSDRQSPDGERQPVGNINFSSVFSLV